MSKLHLYFHQPEPIFKARVNMPGAITYPISQLTYDGVTLGAFGDVAFDATLLLGTAEGLDDLGRVRVKSVPTSTVIPVARASKGVEDGQLTVQDNAYITILDDYRVWAKIPYFDLDAGIDYKDGDIPPDDNNTNIPPVANTGPGFADYIDPDTEVITVTFDGTNSYAMADGATITGYAWAVQDGTITVGTAFDSIITATFTAGLRYVGLTVTDSNGNTHSSRCPVLAVDPADDNTIKKFSATQRLTFSGQTLDIELFEDAPRTTYPDGTLVLFWWDNPIAPDRRDHMKFIGWLDSENFRLQRRKQGFTRSTQLHAVDGIGRLAKLPGFPQALERIFDEAQWSLMPDLDMSKALFYIAFWHSTLINIVDFILPTGGEDYDSTRIDANGGNLKSQLENLANMIVPDHFLCCNSQGQVSFLPNWLLQDEEDRPEVDPILIEEDYADLQGEYDRHPKIHMLRSGAILVHTELIEINGEQDVPLIFSIAPSDAQAFGQGVGEQIESEGLALSQDDLNICEGHRYAMLNSRHGRYSFTDPRGTLFWVYEPALLKRVQLELSAEYAAQRGLDWTVASGQVQEITVQYNASQRGVVINPSVSWIKETSGYPALTYVPEDSEEVGFEPPPEEPPTAPPEDLIEGIDLVAAFAPEGDFPLYRTADFSTPSGSGGPTWERFDLGITDVKLFSFVVDPFSPGYTNQNGTGTVNGWLVGESKIWRVTDFFGATPAASAVHTFPTAISTSSIFQSRTINASFGRYQEAEEDNPWLIVISHYANEAGHTGTWATYSVDGGVTWAAEVQLSAHYDTDLTGNEAHLKPALWLSPRTPGLAYSCAFTATSNPAPAVGYVTTDWGATWTAMAVEEDPAEPLPLWLHWSDDGGGTLTDLGIGASRTVSNSSFSDGPSVADDMAIQLCPPADTKRIVVRCDWTCENISSGGPGSNGTRLSLEKSSTVARAGDSNHVDPAVNSGPSSGSFESEYTFVNYATQDWPFNREEMEATPPTVPVGIRYELGTSANAADGQTRNSTITITVTVTEIELDDSTTYTPITPVLNPINRLAGDIHVPWTDNLSEAIVYSGQVTRGATLQYRLLRSNVDGTVEDISPVSSTIPYGPNRYGFAIRAYDPDRQFVLVGASGNDATNATTGDKHGLWRSEDGGDTWAEIVAPMLDNAFGNFKGLSAAFAADNAEVMFVWGAPAAGGTHIIDYSTDGGATLDDRSGNLFDDFGDPEGVPDTFLGIAGGPITA